MDINLTQLTTTELVIMLVAGVAALFLGYKIKKAAFFIVWFIIGMNLAMFLTPWLESLVPQIAGSELWHNLIPIAGGLLLALMGFSIEKICVGGIAFALTLLITAQSFGTEPQTLVIGAVVGVILAGLAVTLMKPATIIATSVAGAYAVTLALTTLLPELNLINYYWPLLIGAAALGSVVQFATARHD